MKSADSAHRELLYGSLTQLGDYYPLEGKFDLGSVNSCLKKYEKSWNHYNPRKPNIKRHGLSLTSLDGGMSGIPDLDSLFEYNLENNTRYTEADFNVPTPLLKEPEFQDQLSQWVPFLGRSHVVKLNAGGFFPYHRDSPEFGIRTFRLISLVKNCGISQFCLLYKNGRLFLEPGRLYFLNTRAEHGVFSFGNNATFIVLNVVISDESCNNVIKNLLAK